MYSLFSQIRVHFVHSQIHVYFVKHHYPYICKKNLKTPKGQPQSVITSRILFFNSSIFILNKGRRGRESMAVGFITTYAISAYHR